MTNNKNTFDIPDNLDKQTQKALGIKKDKVKLNMTDKILYIFYIGAKQNKQALTLDQITIAYYNLFYKSEGKIRSKKEIALKLYNMRGAPNKEGVPTNNIDWIELIPGKRGTYKLKSSAENLAKRRIDNGEIPFSELNLEI